MKTQLLFWALFLFVINLTYPQCPSAGYTCIIDSNFEGALITQGIDTEGTLDGRILTSDISTRTFLDVNRNGITDLTGIEDFIALEQLNCDWNNLVSLNLSNNSALRVLLCNNNQIENTLDLSANNALENVVCNNNKLTDLVLPSSPINLTQVFCQFNDLTTLDVTGAVNLDRLNFTQNTIPTINLANNTKLTRLFCSIAGLESLNLTTNVLLERVDCDRNLLTSLLLPNTATLNRLYCYGNNLTEIDAGELMGLEIFNCNSNFNLTTLTLPSTTTLRELYACCASLSNLDFSGNTSLQYLDLGINDFASLDVSMLNGLIWFWCNQNDLTYLNINNNSNDILGTFRAQDNLLTCIQVDDVVQANQATIDGDWVIDGGVNYSTSCPPLSTLEFNKEMISIYPNPTNNIMHLKLTTGANYSLINPLGKVVSKGELIAGENQINVTNLTNGIYFLKVKSVLGDLTKKVLKK
ncbi:T9SS type A sorting domain-containing protein [Hyunsoonleella aestuarii]|uniref:Secretion system C-terminal sorting domain-containing protein n=1 Tax=Hyunsoonleella aestuarii TaxID=912802 RepID=A0ABP8ECU3_9FLAO|nr:T9SS type A sorting domain-containing protein [Hyunsoonleella aestuarii]